MWSKCCFRGFYALSGSELRGETEALALVWVLKNPSCVTAAQKEMMTATSNRLKKKRDRKRAGVESIGTEREMRRCSQETGGKHEVGGS